MADDLALLFDSFVPDLEYEIAFPGLLSPTLGFVGLR